MTLQDYCNRLGWSQSTLATESNIHPQTISKAMRGLPVSPKIAQAIVNTISRALNERILPGEVKGLVIYQSKGRITKPKQEIQSVA